jgi:signal transduction histidine kinase
MLPLLAVALASLAAAGAGGAWIAARSVRANVERQLRSVADVLAHSNFPLTNSVLRQMRKLCGAEFVLADDAGAVRASSLKLPEGQLPKDISAQPANDLIDLSATLDFAGRSYFHSVVEVRRPSPDDRQGELHILFPRDEYLRAWRRALTPPLIVGVVSIAAAAAVARLVAGRISLATSSLGTEVERLARGDYAPIDLPRRDDELRDLVAAVNRTAAMLAEYERQIRTAERTRTAAILGAGLAHELRNSATGCRLALDLHAERFSGVDAVDGATLEVARRQLKLMETLLQRFLRVGQPNQQAPKNLSRAPSADFSQLVSDLIPLVEPGARHSGVALRWTPASRPVTVRADPEELSHAVLNLLLNAIEAAQSGAASGATPAPEVQVALNSSEHTASLTVSDTGAGPAEDVRQSLFEPFVTTKPEGVGLGLAVVKQIAEQFGGAVSWDRRGTRTQFSLSLPLA